MHFQDILATAEEIDSYLQGMSLDDYLADRTTRLVIERLLQILTEAAIRLGDAGERYCEQENWRDWRNLGNVIRHAYHRIDDRIIWTAATTELTPLKVSVRNAMVRLTSS